MVWQADKPDLPTVVEAKAMSGATEKCEDSDISQHYHTMSAMFEERVLLYFYELINMWPTG